MKVIFMKKEKISAIIGAVCAALLIASGIYNITFKLIPIGVSVIALTVAVSGFFVYALKKGNQSLVKLALFLYFFGLFIEIVLIAVHLTGFLEYIIGLDENEMKQLIESADSSFGAILVFILLQFLQVTFLPIPSTATTLVGAYLFGWWSVVYSLIGIMAGSLLAFFIGRKFGVKVVRWIAGQEALDKYYGYTKGKDKTILFLMFVFPLFPDDVLCMIAGLTNMKPKTFLGMMMISRPIQAVTTVFSAQFMARIPFRGWGAVLWIAVGIIALAIVVFAIKNSAEIERRFIAIFKNIKKKKNLILARLTRKTVVEHDDSDDSDGRAQAGDGAAEVGDKATENGGIEPRPNQTKETENDKTQGGANAADKDVGKAD
ncbi:MAG: TVP38/TMEM64 family protein [Clostridiales bacterium]|jgi:uncharacterized membrane protein YdjX (TVP38/TMEM64 family)|nr:TVP38/TMEM64 family protein [Clostridiales bacterium]